jgi:hypothetical protein
MDLSTFLTWLAGAGSLIAASWILGQFAWYTNLVEKTKQWIFFCLALVFAGGSYAVSTYVPAETLLKISPWFLIVAFIFSAIFINKSYTKLLNIAKDLVEFKASFLASKKK